MTIEQTGYKTSTAILYWITTAFIGFTLISGGLWLMAGTQPMDAYLGFPAYFWQILGFWKVLGGVTILVPRLPLLKEWAYAGTVFNMTGAAAARIFVGDTAGHIIAPIVICGIAIASWYLRPASRRLTSPQLVAKEQNES
ncbi:MAG TPA: DoxX family protein [Pyrinomonadaceae bacterium]|nr:DoxX family protein [Pyrinomonadaceae bacterium]